VGGPSPAASAGGLVRPCFGTLEAASTPGTPTSWPGCFTCSRAAACLKAPHKDPCRATSRLQGGKRRVPTLRVLRESVLSRSSCRRKPAVEEANIGLPRSSTNSTFNAANRRAGHLADQRRQPAVTTRQNIPTGLPKSRVATFQVVVAQKKRKRTCRCTIRKTPMELLLWRQRLFRISSFRFRLPGCCPCQCEDLRSTVARLESLAPLLSRGPVPGWRAARTGGSRSGPEITPCPVILHSTDAAK
jgi:hypothetical protein